MDRLGFPLLLAQALETIREQVGPTGHGDENIHASVQSAPTKIHNVARPYQKREHAMRTRPVWFDDELGGCVCDMYQRSMDVVDLEDFSRQMLDVATATHAHVYVDRTDHRGLNDFAGAVQFTFDYEG